MSCSSFPRKRESSVSASRFDFRSNGFHSPAASGSLSEQGFRAAALRGLLLALPKSNQKARRPTRCCAARQRSTMPCASRLRRGSLDVRPCTFAHARASGNCSLRCSTSGIHAVACARACGHLPPQPAMLGTAKAAVSCTNPSILGLRPHVCDVVFLPLTFGPPLPRRGHGGIVREEGAQDVRPFANGHGCPSSEPRRDLAYSQGFTLRARHRGRPLFGYFLLAVEEKVTRSPQASGSSVLEHRKSDRRWMPAFAGMTSEALAGTVSKGAIA